MPTITATAQTTDPGTEANVTVTGDAGTYQLAFSIPEGPTGPINGLAAYGGIYNNLEQTVNITSPNTGTDIVLTTNMPSKNITTAANKITILEAGDYAISYSADLTPENAATIKVYADDSLGPIVQSITTNELEANKGAIFANTIITTLDTSDNIALQTESSTNTTITVNNATLTVRKLDTGETA